MPTPLEAEISALLRKHLNVQVVADELVGRWRTNLLSLDEQFDCAQFLINTGLHGLFFEEVARLAQEQGRLPWAQLSEAIGRAKVRPKDNELLAIFEGARAQSAVAELVRSKQLELFDKQGWLRERRQEVSEQWDSRLKERKQELKDKLDFMRDNRLIHEEAKVIEEIQDLFPGESGIQEEKKQFQIRLANEIVAKSSTASDPIADLRWKAEQLSPDQVEAKKLIVASALELAQKYPARASDLALSLRAMEFHTEALSVLKLAPESVSTDWLRLELLFEARQFVSVLEEADRLENKYASEPESSFAAVYSRARALRELGQTAMALDLLRSLVRIRPNYKSAHSLLLEWSEGEA